MSDLFKFEIGVLCFFALSYVALIVYNKYFNPVGRKKDKL